MTQITQYINMEVGNGWNGGGNGSFIEETGVQARVNMADFDGTITAYFEGDLYTSVAGQTTTVELYNHTDGSSVTSSTITSTNNSSNAERQRSGSITLSGDKDYTVRLKHSSAAGAAYIYGARIIIVQTGTITKTQVRIELGNETNSLSSTSSTNRPSDLSRFLYEASKYDGTVVIRHDAVLKAPAGQTITSGIYDETGTSIVSSSEVNTTTSSAYTRVSSGNITLTDGHIYKPTAYVTSGTGSYEQNHIIISLTGTPTKFLAMWPNLVRRSDATTNTSFVYDNDSNISWDTSDFSNATVAYSFETDMSITDSAQTVSAVLRDFTNSTDYSGSTVTLTGTTSTDRTRSGALTAPGSAINIGAGIKSSNSSATARLNAAFLILEVTNIGGSALSINVFDSSTITDVLVYWDETIFTSESLTVEIIDTESIFDSSAVTDVITQILITDFINIFDSSAVTESITIAAPLAGINIFDSSTVTENIQVEIVDTDFIFDSSAVTESVTMLITDFIIVFDSSAVTESVAVSLFSINFVNVFDSSAITEDVQLNVSTAFSTFDSSVVTESTTVIITDDEFISDSSAVTESVTISLPLAGISVFDSSVVSDQAAMQPHFSNNAPLYYAIGQDLSIMLGPQRAAFWSNGSRPTSPIAGEWGINVDNGTIEFFTGFMWIAIPTGTSTSSVQNEVPSGSVNGINQIFTTTYNYQPGTIQVYLNGLRQKINDDYTESAVNTITFLAAPFTGDKILVDYLR